MSGRGTSITLMNPRWMGSATKLRKLRVVVVNGVNIIYVQSMQ